MFTIKSILRYLLMTVGVALLVIGLNNCSSAPNQQGTNQQATTAPPVATSTASMSNSKPKINLNSAILSELDKLEAQLAIPALSNKIQASRPYGTIEDLVSKKVVTQEQFDQVKDQITVEDIVLTGEAKDIDYMTKLGLMKGHMIVAKELLDLKKPEQAEPHIGHPVEEIYADIQDQLGDRKVPEFSELLVNVQNLVKTKPNDPKLTSELSKAMGAIDGAITALGESERKSPEFVLKVINGILDVAGSEYSAAITQGKISEVIEYQDSRGFVQYVSSLYEEIEPKLSQDKSDNSKGIKTSIAELSKAWPQPVPPATPVLSVEQVVGKIKSIEKQVQALNKTA